jgi:Flp pilus assembly protein TadD
VFRLEIPAKAPSCSGYMASESSEHCVQLAILDFTMGDYPSALQRLNQVIADDPSCFEAHLARTEVLYADTRYEEALASAHMAERLQPHDIHLNTSLSRIWMQLGNKETAEHYGTQAKLLSWKSELLRNPTGAATEN